MKREQKRKVARRDEQSTETSDVRPSGEKNSETLKAETDDLLDEIDKLLDTELVAKEYVQKGGE